MSVHVASFPAGPLDLPNWTNVLDAEASSEGSTGVVFVLTGFGGYVIKASSRPAEEYFASLLFEELGLPSVRARCVGHTTQEWGDIKKAIRGGASARRARGDESGALKLHLRLNGPLDRPQLLIMELVSNAAPLEGYMHAKELFEVGPGAANLCKLGQLLMVDVFLNNSDRIKAKCWDNDGNGGNVLVHGGTFEAGAGRGHGTQDEPSIIPIDSVVTALKPSAPTTFFEKYHSRVQTFLEELCAEHCDVGNVLGGVRDFVRENTGAVLSDDALGTVRKGALDGISLISGSLDGNCIDTIIEKCKAAIAVDWEGVWASSCGRIDADFLKLMHTLFADTASKHGLAKIKQSELLTTGTTTSIPLGSASDGDPSRPPSVSPAVWNVLPEAYKASSKDETSFLEREAQFHKQNMANLRPGWRPKMADLLAAKDPKEVAQKPSLPVRTNMAEMLAGRGSLAKKISVSSEMGELRSLNHPLSSGILGELRSRGGGAGLYPTLRPIRDGTRKKETTQLGGESGVNAIAKKTAVQQAVEAKLVEATKRASADDFFGRFCAGESRFYAIESECSLAPILERVNNALASNTRELPIVVAFDFDQTLTDPGGGLRGGEASLAVLKDLWSNSNIELVIITATKPSTANVKAIHQEVRRLGLEEIFDATQTYRRRIQQSFEGDLESLSAVDLTKRLAALIAASADNDRCGSDLWRIDFKSVAVDTCKGTACFQLKTLPPDVTNEDKPLWGDLGPLSTLQLLKASESSSTLACPVATLRSYLERTAPFRIHPSTEALFLNTDESGETWVPQPIAQERLSQLLVGTCQVAGLKDWETRSIQEGDAVIVRAGAKGDVPLAVGGRVICSAYNKPDALHYFIKSRSLTPKRVFFVDDNAGNALAMFMAMQESWPTSSFWFRPPPYGKPEAVDPAVLALVEDVTRRLAFLEGFGGWKDSHRGPEIPPGTCGEIAPEEGGRVLLLQAAAPRDATAGAVVVAHALGRQPASGPRVAMVLLRSCSSALAVAVLVCAIDLPSYKSFFVSKILLLPCL